MDHPGPSRFEGVTFPVVTARTSDLEYSIIHVVFLYAYLGFLNFCFCVFSTDIRGL